MIRNPNDIVERLVADFLRVLDSRLVCVVLYGSAVSHEYRPGKSDVNIAIVLTDTSIPVMRECLRIQKKWMRRGIAAPFYLTAAAIKSLSDLFPVEFISIRHSYRILYGDDLLAGGQLHTDTLRCACRRELAGLVLHLKREFGRIFAAPGGLGQILEFSLRRLLPVFRAVLILYDRKIPNSRAEVIAAVEDLFGLGASAFSDVCNASSRHLRGKRANEIYDLMTRTVEAIADHIGRGPDVFVPDVERNASLTN